MARKLYLAILRADGLFGKTLIFVALTILVSACGPAVPTMTPAPSTRAPPTATPVPSTSTPVPPTATTVPLTDAPSPTTEPTATATSSAVAYEVTRGVSYGNAVDQSLDIYLPEEAARQPPTLLVLGGTDTFLRHFAQLGYTGLAVHHGGGSFEQGVASAFCALAWTHANTDSYGFDPRHIVIAGGSIVGGQVAAVGVADDPVPYLEDCPHPLPAGDRLAGVITLAGALDMVDRAAIDGSEPPFLLIHGTRDSNVEARESQSFAAALERARVAVELVLLPNVSHSGVVSSQDTYRAIEAFLAQLSGLSDSNGGGAIAFVSVRSGVYSIYLMNADGTGTQYLTQGSYPTWSPDGNRIAYSSEHGGTSQIFVKDMATDDRSVHMLTDQGTNWEPAWSPDGTRIAFGSTRDGNPEIYVLAVPDGTDADGGDPRRLTHHEAADGYPCWSPDSTQIAFVSNRDGSEEIYVTNAGGAEPGAGNLRRLTDNDAEDWDPDWSPDGARIALVSNRDGDYGIYTMTPDGSDQRPLAKTQQGDWNPTWSPDGQRIVFASSRDGDLEIHVMTVPDGTDAHGENVQKLTDDRFDNKMPAWRPGLTPSAAEGHSCECASLDPLQAQTVYDVEPSHDAASWSFSTPEEEGMDSDLLEAGVAALAEFGNLYSVLIVRNDKIVLERYFRGVAMCFAPRELARFGLLYLHDGAWDGRQVVPAQWIAESMARHVDATGFPGVSYGYYWWIESAAGHEVYAAVGHGGQTIRIVSGLNLVVVTTAESYALAQGIEAFPLLEEYVIPSIEDGIP